MMKRLTRSLIDLIIHTCSTVKQKEEPKIPNWCYNTVQLTHADPAMLERARKGFNEGKLLSEFLPVPQELMETLAQFGANEQEKLNIEKYGYASWYDWCIDNWGTKWDVGADGQPALALGEDFGQGLVLNFDSAWSPPIAAYAKLVEMGFGVKAYYNEPGMAFAGIWEDGNDDYYEYGGMNSAGVAEYLPDELDETFGISDSMAEWEAENEISEE